MEDKRQGGGRNLGCSIFGWVVFSLALVFLAVLGYKVWFYYGALSRGELIDLPQFEKNFSSTTQDTGFSIPVTERNRLEKGDFASLGPGADEAELTIVEFGDFQCPFCRQVSAPIRQIMIRYDDRVRLVWRHFPLDDIHPDAVQAAIASECALEQDGFWVYHDKLFINQTALGFNDLLRYAQETGLDTEKFEKCLIEEKYKDKVETDMRLGATLGLRGTPTFFFNGQKIEGAIPQDVFEQLIQKLLQ